MSPTAAQLPQSFPDSPSDSPLAFVAFDRRWKCQLPQEKPLCSLSLFALAFPSNSLMAEARPAREEGESEASQPDTTHEGTHDTNHARRGREQSISAGYDSRSPISCGHAHTPNPSPLAKHDATNAFPASFLTPAHTLGWSWPQPGDRAVPQGGPWRLRPTMPVIKYGHDVKFTLLWSFTTWNSRGKGVPYHLMQRSTQYLNFLASNSGLNRFFRQPAASAGCGRLGAAATIVTTLTGFQSPHRI